MVRPEVDPSAPQEVAVALRDGSREALESAYTCWAPLVYTFAMRALGNHHDAEDVTQQVFVSAWRSRHTIRPAPHTFPAWLIGIAKNRVADMRTDRFRAHRNTAAVAAVTREEVARPDVDLAERLLVEHHLAKLGHPKATVLRMALVEDRPHEQIAQILDLPLGTVKSHVRRGLLALRSGLEEASRVPS